LSADDFDKKLRRAVRSAGQRDADGHPERSGKRPPKPPGGGKPPRAQTGRGPGGGPGGVRAGARPPLRMMTTTLWEYPSQHYDPDKAHGPTPTRGSDARAFQGNKDYVGATPSWVIWQLLQRFTREGATVVDPMCGSGTTLDVAADLNRRGIGFDLNPTRPEIRKADARELPLDDETADFAFIDPPYSTHIDYSDDGRCIGKLDAGEASVERLSGEEMVRFGAAYYEAMEEVIAELHRVLRPGAFMGLYVQDSWRKLKGQAAQEHGHPGLLMPIGFELFSVMRDYFVPVDIVAVVRHNQKLQRGNWHKAADEQNFFLRGFNYLFIMRKPG